MRLTDLEDYCSAHAIICAEARATMPTRKLCASRPVPLHGSNTPGKKNHGHQRPDDDNP